jgi:hypothetical protein
MSELTPKMERLLRVVTDEPALAYDLAQAAEIDNRSAGSVLNAMAVRGLVRGEYDESQRVFLWQKA